MEEQEPEAQENPLKDEWITTNEAASLTGYRPIAIRQAVYRGHIGSHKIGNLLLVNRDDALRYKEAKENEGYGPRNRQS